MVEVFKTDITTEAEASVVLKLINGTFRLCRSNFDLDDCDNILRVETEEETIDSGMMIMLISKTGYHAEVLSDEAIPAADSISYYLCSDDACRNKC